MSDERDQEAEKCIDVAKRALSDGDLTKSIKFLKKSLNFRHSAVAENLLKKVEEELSSTNNPHRRATPGSPSSSASPTSPTASGTASSAGASTAPPSSSMSSPSSSSADTAARGSGHTAAAGSSSSGPAKRAAPSTARPAAASAPSAHAAAASDAPKKVFTPEQQAAARKINKTSDYYLILGIERTADEAGVKAAYRKMALRFHPDKNHAPEAEEAFKKVSEAYTCLSDANEREYYNQNGNRGNAQRAARAAYADAQGGYRNQPMTPEELFNMFFEAQGVRRHHQFHRRPQQHAEGGEGQQRGSLMSIAHFLPLILLFLFSFMSGPSTDNSPFSLDKSDTFSVRRITPQQTPYFVNPSFARNYARDYRALAQVEAQADQMYFKKLEDECRVETKDQKMKVAEAKRSKSADQAQLLQKAYSMNLPSCTRLSELGRR